MVGFKFFGRGLVEPPEPAEPFVEPKSKPLALNFEPTNVLRPTDDDDLPALFQDPKPKGIAAVATEEDAEKRRRRDVLPTDAIFLAKETDFEEQLGVDRAKVADIINNGGFTTFEKKLLCPTTREINLDLFKIQTLNKSRFQRLCAGTFQGKDIQVQTKLAMLWFGLPVEPLDSGIVDASALGIRIALTPKPAKEAATNTPAPLQFLNRYHTRTYEDDRARRKHL